MVNDCAGLEKAWPTEDPKPYIVWWPPRPDPQFLRFLLKGCPEMKPSWDLWEVSKFSLNPFYREDQEKRAKEKTIQLGWNGWKDLWPIYHYCDLIKTREFTVLDPYEERIRDTVEEYKAPNSYEKILNAGDVQHKVWEGIGRVSSAN